jgi:glycosyltransferase involved in cell wall biosynthesis
VTIDVVLCTHDPRPEVLALALRSIARQTARLPSFRVVVVDSASSPPLGEEILAPLRAAEIDAALVREDVPGLVRARLRAARETGAPWMLFVDDDNELADDYVEAGLAFLASRSDVGCFGGRILLPSTVCPPRWATPFLPWLGIRDPGGDVITGSSLEWGPWEPAGAGFWIRRDQLEAYRSRVERDPRALALGRSGRGGLASCEDSLMAREGVRLGLLNAYVPGLVLWHHLDPARFRLGYLCRLLRGFGESRVLLEALLADGPVGTPCSYRGLRFLRRLASEVNAGRKRSLAFGAGMAAFHVGAWAAYRRQREEG